MNYKLAVILGKLMLGSFAALVIFFVTFKVYNYYKYRDAEITSYQLLVKKADYAKISNEDLRKGVFYLYEDTLCKNESEKCLDYTEVMNHECAVKYLEPYDVSAKEQMGIDNLMRRISYCFRHGS
jgi:hypothetical protein